MNPLFDIIEEDSRLETRNETVYFADGMVDIILHIPESADGSTIAVAAAFLSIFSTIVTMTIKEDTGVIRAFNKFISHNVSLMLLGLPHHRNNRGFLPEKISNNSAQDRSRGVYFLGSSLDQIPAWTIL